MMDGLAAPKFHRCDVNVKVVQTLVMFDKSRDL